MAGEITVEQAGGVWVLALAGEHDLSTRPGITDAIESTLAAGGPLVVDLSATEFIDSTVIGAIVLANRRAPSGGIALVVPAGNATVRRVLDLTGVTSAVATYGTAADAIASLSASNGAPG